MSSRMEYVALWDAINKYTEACGGDTSKKTAHRKRMDAVVEVENSLEKYTVGKKKQ